MRFWLAVLLIFCMAGFIVTSGTISVHAGRLRINPAALSHSIPVLIALAAPMITMAVVLMVTMAVGRQDRQGRNR